MTGEMSAWDLTENGEHYEWSQTIKFAALKLMRMTKKKVKLNRMRPFDVYQGPYAQLNYGRLWSGTDIGTFYYSGVIDKMGTIREIADEINLYYSK